MRQIIFGLYDKTTNSYIGYFKNEEDAKTEMSIQKERIEREYSYDNMVILENKVTVENTAILVIHPIVLR